MAMISDGHGKTLLEDLAKITAVDKPMAPPSEPKARRGLNGITSRGRRTVRSAAVVMEKAYGRQNCSFITTTLPPGCKALTEMNWVRLAAIVDRFRRSLTRISVEAGLDGEILLVIEMQMERWRRTGELAWHLHLLMQGRKPGKGWALTSQQIQQCWNECLQQYEGEHYDHINWNATCNVKRVIKSASGYLGKYMSKAGNDLAELRASLPDDAIPAAWYTCSHKLSSRVRRATIYLTGTGAERVLLYIRDRSSRLLSYDRIIIWTTPDGFDVPVGWFGYLKGEWQSEILAIVAKCQGSLTSGFP